MYLKKIELFGFKSFASRTEIVFEEGVTCVVGPNGCGKSNVSDAIRWVLGERSAKSLRGSSMEDVIFNGTDFRKPLNLAEVSITIDNSKHLFPLEYDEVVLTRRIYRLGETEYFINKTPCRLKDIRELTMDTGLGSNAYSMIGQGKIDYILNADPEERRGLIEEAAGIAKYKSKKEEALRKLERTENNLLRLNDIISEVEKNIKYAERQARRAQRYKEQFDELKRLETIKAFRELDGIKTVQNDLQSKKAEIKKTEKENQQIVNVAAQTLQAKENEFQNAEKEANTVETQRYKMQATITAADERLRYIKTTLQELAASKNKLTSEIELARQKIVSIDEEQKKRKDEAEQFVAGHEKSFERHRNFEEKMNNLSNEIEQYQSLVTSKKQTAFECAKNIADVHNELNKVKVDLATHKNRMERLSATIGKSRVEKNEVDDKIAKTKSDIDELGTKINVEQKELEGLKEKQSLWENTLSSTQDKLITVRSQKELTASKIQALQELNKQLSAQSNSAINLIEESRSDESPLHNLISTWFEQLQIQQGFEPAIRAALCEHLNDVVVNDWKTIFTIIDYLKGKPLSDVGILVNHISTSMSHDDWAPDASQHPGILGPAKKFVKAPSQLQPLIENQLKWTFVTNTLTANDCTLFQSLPPNCRLVTLKGDIIGPGSYVKVANKNNKKKNNNLSALDIGSLKAERIKHEDEEKETVKEVDEGRAKCETIKNEINKDEEKLQEQRVQLESMAHLLASLESQSTKLEEEIQVCEIEYTDSSKDTNELSQKESSILEKKLTLEKSDSEFKASLEEEAKELDRKRKEKEQLTIEWAKFDAEIRHLKERKDHYNETLTLLGKEAQETNERIARYENELRQNEKRKEELLQEEQKLSEQKKVLKVEFEEVEKKAKIVRSKKDELAQEKSELADKNNQAREKLTELKESQHEMQMKIMELEYQSNAIYERLQQTYKIDLKQLDRTTLETDNVPNDSDLESFLETLRKKVESLGTVNLLAIEEYDELKKRFDFLDTQRNDLTRSRESLLEAIRKINRTTRSLFIETFGHVQERFREYYRTLFGGGNAELKLLDESHPLESGIDIVARPPGKKLQNISLLSGGEKALTAIALLFALFKIKPSPFCLLDEVDAPLDEANIDRFLAILRQFTASTQFIIITHNRKTIAMGNCLYGITMEEAGISKVVSVKLGDVKEDFDIQHDIISKRKVRVTTKVKTG